MATYGYDQYGRATYGPFVKVDYGVQPFTAVPLDYTRVYLAWHEPVGPWDEFRLIRSRSGYASAPDDGLVLIQFAKTSETPPVVENYLDPNLVGGYYYYTILLHSTQSDVWEIAGATSVLVPWDYESTEKLWSYVPEWYRVIRSATTAGYSEVLFQANPAIYQSGDDAVDNNLLFNFMTVFGWGYDTLRSQIETTLSGFDPSTVHVNRLGLLADMFGAVLPDTVPTQNNRNLVKNLALLYRKRGTLGGLRETLALTSGWDVDVYQGPNMLLSRDKAAFTNLDIKPWDKGTRYVLGDIIRYNNYYRQALQTAYGAAQAPPTTPTNNSYWSVNPFTQPTIFLWNPVTGDGNITTRALGWQVLRLDTNLPFLIGLGLGITNPITVNPDGALSWTNNSAVFPLNTLVRSVPAKDDGSAPDREDVVKYGIPVPRVTVSWVDGQTYFRGDRVVYNGSVYEAVTETEEPPSDDTWNRIGYGDRVRLGLSFYAHGPFTGTAGTGGIPVAPWVGFYDESGAELIAKTTVPGLQIYDSFTSPGSVGTGRAPDVSVGGQDWTSGATTWGEAVDGLGGYAYPTSSGQTSVGFVAAANGNVGFTVRKQKIREIGAYFRATDGSNYWEITITGLFKVIGGVRTQVGSSYAAADGDRVTVSFNGNAITVKKNGTTVVSTTDSYNSSATFVGLVAEAV